MFARFLYMVIGTVFSFAANAITIEFDYSYDSTGFFTEDYRAVMEQAAGFYSNISDSLAAIDTTGQGNWQVVVSNPSSPASAVTLDNLILEENTLKILVGASPLPVPALGIAFSGNVTADANVADQVINRGQGVTTGENAMDYATWGGSIWFNSVVPWSVSLGGPAPNTQDFLTTAVHELGHLFGVGTADSWFNQTINIDDQWYFVGQQAMAVYGGPVPLDPYLSHWAEGVVSTTLDGIEQETLMDPSTGRGERQLMTVLDQAALQDIGWQVATVPLPGALGYYVVGLLSLLITRCRLKKPLINGILKSSACWLIRRYPKYRHR